MIPGNFLEDNRQMIYLGREAPDQIGRTIEFDYGDVPTVRKFAMSNLRIRGLMGPVGCLSGDSLVLTEQGPRRICDLTRPTRVLSWNEKKCRFELAQTGGSFQKGTDYLYRVSTRRGDIVAAGHHLLLCADHTYRRVSDLRDGDALSLCSPDQIERFVSDDPISFPANAYCFDRIISNSMARYARSARLYGQRLLREVDIGPAFSPLPAGAHTLSRLQGDWDADAHMDGREVRSQERSRPGRFFGPKRTGDCPGLACHLRPDEGDRILARPFARTAVTLQRLWRSLWMFASRHVAPGSSSCSHSSESSLSDGTIISIVREPVKKIFWDLQVCDTNNYVTVDGMIHHNSGKSSGCVIELIRRGHEQAPMADGVRRTRWAIVRNTYRQLEDTTIKTVHDWLPPDLYGDWNKTDHNYKITAFPGVEIEFMFRALDRPDQLSNLLSLEITGAWLNEFREIPKVIFDVLDTRVGRYPPPREVEASWVGIIMDTNPPDEHNPYYKYFEKTKPSNARLWKQPSGLSPHAENIKNLRRHYYQDLVKGKDEQFINVYAHGLYGYVTEGSPVYKSSYNDNTHVSPSKLTPVRGIPLITGWDFGLNPSVVIGQILPTSRILIYRAISSDGMGLEKFLLNQVLPMLKQEFFGFKVLGFGDPAGTQRVQTDEKTCYDIFRENGLYDLEQAPSNNLVARQRAVEAQLSRSVFGEQAVVIDPEQDLLRKALSSGYRFKQYPNGEVSDTPDKNFYCVDLQTVAMTPNGWLPWSKIKEGDRIFGFDGKRIVLDRATAVNVYPDVVEAVHLTMPQRRDLFYTDRHRCLAFFRDNKNPQVIEAGELNRNWWLVTMKVAGSIGDQMQRVPIARVGRKEVEGVWCPTTTTGFWVAKRGQQIVITGNSHIANAFEYFCMFIGDHKGRVEREEQMRKQLARTPTYKRVSNIAGY